MYELSETEQDRFLEFFARLNDEGVRYVVLRKYEQLPEYAPSDVDLFVEPDGFDRAVELSEDVGFERSSGGGSSGSRFGRALRRPRKTVQRALTSPGAVVRTASELFERPSDDIVVCHRRYGNVKLDMVNGLRFPERGGEPVPPPVERAILSRRERHSEWYTPSPPDELAHIVAHCLADYDGAFSEYYVDRCDELRETVFSDPSYRTQFRELTEHLFERGSTDVVDAVAVGDYDAVSESASL